ncbi:MAG TPA: glycosyltransferase [Polyangiaceae bacterium]|nr:glycosyltransferase [Polyangiaceae bacterium]
MPAPFLLIAFRFPPCDRIGAYRWSKLCGRLARLGHVIDVLSAPWNEAEDPGWFGDVQHPNIRIHRVGSLYPHRLRGAQYERRALQKLHGRAFRWLDRLLPPHDIASSWGIRLLPAAARLLEARPEPRVVVATGAPFSANAWAARIALGQRGVRLIQDFRDPWFSTREEFDASPRARAFVLATRAADLLVSVTPEMTELYRRLSGHRRVATVPNGVELASIREAGVGVTRQHDFAYIGNLYNAREAPLERFLDWVREKRRSGAAPRTVIAGLYPHHLRSQHRDLVEAELLSFHPQLPQRRAFELVAASRWALHFNGPGALGTFQTTTKLVEHAALGRPTLSLNYGGATEDFIRAHDLGWSFRADSAQLFAELDRCWLDERRFGLRVSEFDFDSTARLYSSLIDDLARTELDLPTSSG